MKILKIAVPLAAIVWLVACFLPSHDMGEFGYRVMSDVGYVLRLSLVVLTLFGGAYLIYGAFRQRRDA